MRHRRVLAAGAALLLCGFATAAKAADANPPIKVAFLSIDAGTFAIQEKENIDGVTWAVDYINQHGGVDGRKLELVFETDDGTPASALTAANRAVKQDGARFIMGMFTSSIAASLSPRAPSLGAIVIDPWSQSDDLVGKGCGANYFRTSTSNSQIVNGVLEFVKQSNIKEWDLLSVDYAAGHDMADKFGKALASIGGHVDANLFTPLGNSDFGSMISQLQASPAKALLLTVFGSDAASFAKQAAQFGLFSKYSLVLGNGFVSPTLLPVEGENVLGVSESLSYEASLDNAKNDDFVAGFHKQYKNEEVSYNDADIYVGLMLLKAAIEQTKSTEIATVKAALAGMKADTVYGPVEMRAADHQLIRPELIVKVEKGSDGKPGFVVTQSIQGALITPPPSPDCKM